MTRKKKQHVNRTGVYYFADEYRKLYPSYSGMSNHDLIVYLLPRWHSMTLVERKPYEDLAKQYKRARMLNNENVITPVIPSSEEALFIEQNNQENQYLDSYFSIDLLDIYRRNFLFVTFQIFCRTDNEDGGVYYPAEIAIMKYSFSQNIQQEYFTIIKPEKFPVGYTGTAIDLSRETHQIPPFDFIGANGDYPRIWQDVKRVIGDSIVDSSTNEPIVIFCNAFEREQTMFLLKWLVSKDKNQQISNPLFRVCSFESLVVALLRRIGIGNFAHQSVREQLRRPVYTLQIKERCIYHDSLAIQYCCRAINHGFRFFLDDFIRQRFLQFIPESIQTKTKDKNFINNFMYKTKSSTSDSMSSTFIKKPNDQRKIEQEKSIEIKSIGSNVFIASIDHRSNSNVQQSLKFRAPNPIEIDCRWSTPSLHTFDDEDQYVMTGRGIRKVDKNSDKFHFGVNKGYSRTNVTHRIFK